MGSCPDTDVDPIMIFRAEESCGQYQTPLQVIIASFTKLISCACKVYLIVPDRASM